MSSLLPARLTVMEPEVGEPVHGGAFAPVVPQAGIAEWLLRAAQQPRSQIRWLPGDEPPLTYASLLDDALRILGGLRSQRLAPGAKVALLLERACDFIPCFWACVLGSYVPCPLVPIRDDHDRWTKHLANVSTLLDRPLVVTTGALNALVPDLRYVEIDPLRTFPRSEPWLEVRPDHAALMVLTSGSTGAAKAAVLTHANLFASMAGKNAYQQLTHADITLNWVSFDHVAALLEAHLLPLYARATQLHVDPAAILADPLLFLRLIDRYRVSMTFSPNFLLGQINARLTKTPPDSRLPLDLSCLRHIISGGEANPVATGKLFLELLAPLGLAHTALWPAFGMTETCAGSIYSREFPQGDASHEFAAVGEPVHGLTMRIVDEEGIPIATDALGSTGELQLRGPMVFARYYNDEGATRAVFTTDGWFRTGDVGRIEGGRLRLVGRSKDNIIVNGVNYFSQELESALTSLAGIERSFVAAFPFRPKGADTEQLVITFAPTFPLEEEARLKQLLVTVRNTTLLQWGFRPALILPLATTAFPKTSLGKIQRGLLRRRLESGAFASELARVGAITEREVAAYVAPQGRTEAAVAQIFAELFAPGPATVSASASFFDLGGTSLDIVKLKSRLQERFPEVSLPLAVIMQGSTPRDLAARIDQARRSLSPLSKQFRPAPTSYDPIVPLQPSGGKTPLFCVHAATGEVLVFVSLAGFFAHERPFYAVRARGLSPGESCFSSFREMVDAYVVAIRRRQPHGPYALAGYSYGAPVAFEIAKVLEAQGELVGFLGSIDGTPTIGNVMSRFDFVDSAVTLAFFLGLIDDTQRQTLPARLRALHVAIPEAASISAIHSPAQPQERLLEICASILATAMPERVAQLDLNLPRFNAWARLSHGLVQLGEEHIPSGTVPSLSVFYAQPLTGSTDAWLKQQLRQWDRLTRLPARYIEVGGQHHTVFDSKHIAHFQAKLHAELNRALDGR